jgi:antitoxin component YwqK of YwqJK toxin-antitoxin module
MEIIKYRIEYWGRSNKIWRKTPLKNNSTYGIQISFYSKDQTIMALKQTKNDIRHGLYIFFT